MLKKVLPIARLIFRAVNALVADSKGLGNGRFVVYMKLRFTKKTVFLLLLMTTIIYLATEVLISVTFNFL